MKKNLATGFIGFLLFNQAIAQLQPDDIPGLKLWLRSDTGITDLAEIFVQQWADISGNENHAINTYGVVHLPTPLPDALNGYPAVNFCGVSDFLDLTTEITTVRTVFWLVKEDPSADNSVVRCLLGHHTNKDFLRGTNKELWHATQASPFVVNGTTKINFAQVDGTLATLPNDYSIISLVTTDNVSASSLTMDRLLFGRFWFGPWVELIIYDQPLSESQVIDVENYLADRYTADFYADQDVTVPYGFCDTTICAAPGLDNYLWSTGETSQCIAVNNTGAYVVQSIDRFNRANSDTVNVQFDGFTNPANQLLCIGNEFMWDTQLDAAEYDFMWDDGSTEATNSFSAPGVYQVTITDNVNCELTASVSVEVDSLEAHLSLGPDLSLCSGNTISFIDNEYEDLQYLWSTGATGESITINQSDEYWLQATDANNCVALDTIAVEVVGTAPVISFEADYLCEGVTTVLSAMNISNSNIQLWSWSFSDGGSASGDVLPHSFPAAGDYLIHLSATTVEGCSSEMDSTLHIYQNPTAQIGNSLACNNEPIVFSSESTSPEGDITSWAWNALGTTFNAQNISLVLPEAGFNPVSLTVQTEYGCTDEVTTQVNVMSAPVSGLSFTGQCLGDLTQLNEEVSTEESGPIAFYTWNFGDGTGSFQPNPSHYFSNNGLYNIQLIALAETGCRDTASAELEILNLPVVDFLVANGCVGQPYQFQDFSTSENDPIISWNWNVEGIGNFDSHKLSVSFFETGLNQVTLSVSTENGCTSSLQQAIPVWEVPQPLFTFQPEIAAPPVAVNFSNQTEGANEYYWNFGDGSSSSEQNPVHIFTTDGVYTLELKAINAYGCSQTTSSQITVAIPRLDLVVQEVQCTKNELGQLISMLIVNVGNVGVQRMALSWEAGNDAPVTEEWIGTLLPGNSVWYTFVSLFTLSESQFPYLCTNTTALNETFAEFTPADNERCKSLEEDNFELFPPYPNPAATAMFVRFITPAIGSLQLVITDEKGSTVRHLQEDNVPFGFHEYFLNVSAMADGHYNMEIIQGDKREVQSFVKTSN